MTTWQIFSLVVLLALSPLVSVLALLLMYRSQTRLLRLISQHLGIPAVTMEEVKTPKPIVKPPDLRKRMAIPVPGSGVNIPQSERIHIGPRQ